MKRRCLALSVLLLMPAACNQAPDDDPPGVTTARMSASDHVRQRNRSLADVAPVPKAVKYELQGALGVPHSFPSRERCKGALSALVEAQGKTDKQRSERGVLLPSRPMLTCVAI